MKKSLLLIYLTIFLCAPLVHGEEFPPSGQGIEINKETNPIYWGYFEDYGTKLKDALEAKRMFRLRGMGANYDYIVTRDGEIKNIKLDQYQNEYFNKKVKEIILSVKPLPFREGMNIDEMHFSVYLGYEHYDDISISVGRSFQSPEKIFSIIITTKK